MQAEAQTGTEEYGLSNAAGALETLFAGPLPLVSSSPGAGILNDAVHPWYLQQYYTGHLNAYATLYAGEFATLAFTVTGPDTLVFGVELGLDYGGSPGFRLTFQEDEAAPRELVRNQRYEIPVPAGVHTYRWRSGDDAVGTTAVLFPLSLASTGKPFISPIRAPAIEFGQSVSIPVLVYGTITQSWLTAGPSWLTWDAATRRLSGTPPWPGDYVGSFHVAGAGAQDGMIFGIEVSGPMTAAPGRSVDLHCPTLTWTESALPGLAWEQRVDASAVGGTTACVHLENFPTGVVSAMETNVVGGQYALRWFTSPGLLLQAYKDGGDTPELTMPAWVANPYVAHEPAHWEERVIDLAPGDWRVLITFTNQNDTYSFPQTTACVDYFTPVPFGFAPQLAPVEAHYEAVALEQFQLRPSAMAAIGAAWAASGLPAGMTINAFTGEISGSPQAAGTADITITVTQAGGSASQSFTLTSAPSIAEALDTPDREWFIPEEPYNDPSIPQWFGSASRWQPTLTGGLGNGDALVTVVGEGPLYRRIATTITGPCVVQWQYLDTGGLGSLTAGLDDIYSHSWYPSYNYQPYLVPTWRTAQMEIPEGGHTLIISFRIDDGDSGYTWGQSITLDAFRVSTDGRPMIREPVLPESKLPFGSAFSLAFALLVPDPNASWSAPSLPAGLMINAITGEISGHFLASGAQPLTVKVTTASGTAEVSITLNVQLSFAEALDLPGSDWTLTGASGSYPWTPVYPETADASLPETMVYGSDTPGVLSATFQGPDTLTGWFRSPYAAPQIGLDGALVTVPWQSSVWQPFDISFGPGLHTIHFDSAGTSYHELNFFNLLSTGRPEFARTTVDPKLYYHHPVDLAFPLTNGPATWTSSELPLGLTLDSATGRITGTPLPPGGYYQCRTVFVAVTATNAAGQNSRPIAFTLAPDPRTGLDLPQDFPLTLVPEGCTIVTESGFDGDELWLTTYDHAMLSIPLEGPLTFSMNYRYVHPYNTSGSGAYFFTLDNAPILTGNAAINTPASRLVYTVPAGTHTLRVWVEKPVGGGYSEGLYLDNFRVSTSNPIVSPMNLPIFMQGDSVSLPVTVTGNVASIAVSNLPTGWSFDSQSGNIIGTTTTSYWDDTAQITATAPDGQTDTVTFQVQVGSISSALGSSSIGIHWSPTRFRYAPRTPPESTPYLAQDGPDGSSAPLLSTTLAGPGAIRWRYRGPLILKVDGVPVPSTATYVWTEISTNLTPGAHLLEWSRMTDSAGAIALDSVSLTGYTQWAAMRLVDPSTPLDSDADRDGLSLLQEFALQSDPLRPTPPDTEGSLHFLPSDTRLDGRLVLTWRKPSTSLVSTAPEFSTDGTTWTRVGFAITSDANFIRALTPPVAGSRAFYRLIYQLEP